jgi:hypothetical protein
MESFQKELKMEKKNNQKSYMKNMVKVRPYNPNRKLSYLCFWRLFVCRIVVTLQDEGEEDT